MEINDQDTVSRRASRQKAKKTVTPWQIHKKEDLVPYQRFSVLYGERKFAQAFPEQTQTLSFTDDLSTEIRLEVYSYLQIQAPGRFFEFWGPDAWYPPYNREEVRSSQNNYNLYRRFSKNLRLMRLCRKVYHEVAELFYSKQNFRFTGVNGFPTMTAWMHTIGPSQLMNLRHVTVQHPHAGLESEYGGECAVSTTQFGRLLQSHDKRGLVLRASHYGRRQYRKGINRGWYYYDESVSQALRFLSRVPHLRSLEIVIPWEHGFHGRGPTELVRGCSCPQEELGGMGAREWILHIMRDHSVSLEFWDRLEKLKKNAVSQELVISLVLLYGRHRLSDEESYQSAYDPEMRDPEHMRKGRWLAAYAEVMGYSFGHATWVNGSYSVRYDPDPGLVWLPPPEARRTGYPEPPKIEKQP